MSEHRSFKPATAAEAVQFENAWCDNCGRVRDPARCFIRHCGVMLDPADTDYPTEWRIGDSGPECAAFEPKRRMFG
jgi:hypothetical protein